MCTVHRGTTRLDGAGARSKFGVPMLEPEVFRKQMCCVEESTCDIVGIFIRPPQWFGAPYIDSAPGKLCAPLVTPLTVHYLAWNLAQQLTSWVIPVAIKQTYYKRLLLLIQVLLSVLIKYGIGLIIALEVDEKSLDVKSHSLMSVNRQKGTSPSHFLRNPTFGIISTTERFPMPQITGGEKDFFKFLV